MTEDEVPVAPLAVTSTAGGVGLEASFVSSTGWVKPGDTYPFRVFVSNAGDTATGEVRVTVPVPPATTFVNAVPLQDAGTATIGADGTITWTVPSVPAATEAGPARVTLVVDAVADSLAEDAEVVWKDLSATATMTVAGETATSTTHGPKVIPPSGGFETARYGDKPFAIVQVDFSDRKHQEQHTGQSLEEVVNDPAFEGSTFNLYQEMSFGQLFPSRAHPGQGPRHRGLRLRAGLRLHHPARHRAEHLPWVHLRRHPPGDRHAALPRAGRRRLVPAAR